MGSKLVGFVFLIVALGAFFYLWQNALKNRAKDDLEEPEPELPAQDVNTKAKFTSVSMTPIVELTQEAQVVNGSGSADEGEVVRVEIVTAETVVVQDDADPIAKTHLEIAKQFFDMGDFEGAVELCQIVLENPTATADQKDKAKSIIELCG